MYNRLGLVGGIKVLSKYLRKHKRNFILFYLGWFFETLLEVIAPIIFAIMIDQIVYYRNFDVFLKVSLVFAIMSIYSCLNYFLIYTLHHYLMNMYTFDIRIDLFKKLHRLKANYLSNAKTGDLITMLLRDTEQCMHFIIRNIIHSSNGLLKGLFYIIYIYIISLEAGITITLFLPLVIFVTFSFSKRIRKLSDYNRELYGGFSSWLFEILRGITDIRLLSGQKTVKRDLNSYQRKLFKFGNKSKAINLASNQTIEGINLLLQLAVYSVCAYLAYLGEITIGNVIVLLAFTFALKDKSILFLVQNIMEAQTRLTSIARIRDFLSMDEETSWPGERNLVIRAGDIVINDVHFAYNTENPILKGLTFSIRGGSKIAIVGKSGNGKTTLASLIIGMYESTSGAIFIDGQDIKTCTLKSIRQSIGIVQQDTLIFDGTIRENLMLANPRATETDILEACNQAGILSFVQGLEDQLDTKIGKEGIGLSGGQRQRLGIARIYLKDPQIIIFDEATSALDEETEELIHDAWKDLLQGRTAIVIAHRLRSVQLCNHCILIDDGKVLAEGHPDDLLNNNVHFRDLFAIKEVVSEHAG